MTDEERQYSLNELTEAAGVSARTVRYYIGEGLLPPPVVAGPRSYYTDEHLNRLKLIGHMKEAYLPLKEVRRRLNQIDSQQLALLAEEAVPPSIVDEALPAPAGRPLDSAADYVARLLAPRQPPEPEERDFSFSGPPPQMGRVAFHAYESVEKAEAPSEQGSSWRRIQLADEAELLIREEAYQRNRDRIDWLMDWAKRVFR